MGWSLGIDGKVVDELCNFSGWSAIKALIANHASAVPELSQFAEEGISGSPGVLQKDLARFLEYKDLPDWVGDVLKRLATNIEQHPDAESVYVSDGFEEDVNDSDQEEE